MAIRSETSKGHGIDNDVGELHDDEIRKSRRILKSFPHAVTRTPASAGYNCHGLTFLSRRAWLVRRQAVDLVLEDDGYLEIASTEVMPGDIAVYYSESGDPNHSAIVVEPAELEPAIVVVSKWAHADEVIHPLRHCPNYYGPVIRFYRCAR